MMSASPLRLGILVSHPIQYYSPWFRDLARKTDLQVYYAHRQDQQGQANAGFGVRFEWDVPLLDGYPSQWLQNVSRNPGLDTFRGCDTPELYKLIPAQQFDAFLVIGWNRKSSWQAIRACRRHGVPVLMRGDSQLPMVTSPVKSLIKAVPYRWFLPRIDVHLYVGQRNREYLQHYGVQDSQLVHCPHFVDNDFFAARARDAVQDGRAKQIRESYGIPESAVVVLFVGKLIPKKNPLDFVRAVRDTSGDSPPIHGIVVGSGPLEQRCREAAGDCRRIHFAGFQNQTQLPAFYATADALVLPSDGSETWGLVVNEAMACGTPAIVSSACGSSVDLVAPGVTGYTFDLNRVDLLQDRIRQLARHTPQQSSRMKAAVIERVNQYSISAASQGLLRAVSAWHDRQNRDVIRRQDSLKSGGVQ